MQPTRDSDPTIAAALVAVVTAGQQLLADRFDLALRDSQRMLDVAVVDLALLLVGGLVLAGSLLAVDVALLDRVRESAADAGLSGIARSLPLVGFGLLHALIGGALIAVVVRRRRRAGSAS